MIALCPCKFTAPADVSPNTAAWHRLHRDHHMRVYPKAGPRTVESLDEIVAAFERRAVVAQVLS